MIKIRDITIGGLRDFIESPEYKQMPVIPITRHRGVSHIHNPMAGSDDKILFLAYDEKIRIYQRKFPFGDIYIKTIGYT